MRPKYESESVSGDVQGRRNISLPFEIYERFIQMASDLDYKHQGRVCVMALLDALSEVEPEEMWQFLNDQGLLQKRQTDRLWW